MKKTKVLLTLACAVLLVAASVMGTLAYLTSTTDTVKNTFTVGKVNIVLDEAKVNGSGQPINEDGNVVEELAGAERVTSNEYNLLPGHKYTKDPTVTVKEASEESYVKMVVTVNKANELDKIFADHAEDFTLQDVIVGYDGTKWLLQGKGGEEDAEGNRTYTFYYHKTVSAVGNGQDGANEDVVLEPLFKSIQVPGVLTNDEILTIQGMEINVKAYAIQADGMTDAADAWKKFNEQSE